MVNAIEGVCDVEIVVVVVVGVVVMVVMVIGSGLSGGDGVWEWGDAIIERGCTDDGIGCKGGNVGW